MKYNRPKVKLNLKKIFLLINVINNFSIFILILENSTQMKNIIITSFIIINYNTSLFLLS